MINQSGKIVLVLVLFLLLLGVGMYFFSPIFIKQEDNKQIINSYNQSVSDSTETVKLTESLKTYLSKDLKISLVYPQNWMVDDRYFEVLIANFKTSLNSNKVPKSDEIEIIIHNARGCHETIDENLKDPACGEGGTKVKPNEILSKEAVDINGAKFYKYVIKYPSGEEHKFYFLEKEARVLQIEKKPDPSMLEKEFDEIIKSIQFI